MEKTALEFKNEESDFSTITFEKQPIKVKNFLSPTEVAELITSYIAEYFDEEREEYSQVVLAEYSLMSKVVEIATDKELNPDDFEKFASTNLFELIVAEIKNFGFALEVIHKTIKRVNEKNSIEAKVGELVDKAMDFVDNMTKNGFDKESVSKIMDTVEEIKKLNLITK
ncbi:MAG: hypothetical protein WA061_02355 [Microgenomates group bacterium]